MRDLRIAGVRFADHFAQLQRRQVAVAELLRQVIGERVFDAVVMQDRGVQVRRQQRLFGRRLHGFDAQLRPDAAGRFEHAWLALGHRYSPSRARASPAPAAAAIAP